MTPLLVGVCAVTVLCRFSAIQLYLALTFFSDELDKSLVLSSETVSPQRCLRPTVPCRPTVPSILLSGLLVCWSVGLLLGCLVLGCCRGQHWHSLSLRFGTGWLTIRVFVFSRRGFSSPPRSSCRTTN